MNELTSFFWQVFTVASNTITQRTRKKNNHEAPISFFHHRSRLFDERKKVAGLCFTNATWALEETYESEVVGSPSDNPKMKSVSRFCKQFSTRTKRRRWGTFSQLFPCTTIRYSKHHNNKTAVRPQFPYFLWQVLLVDPYRRANSAMWHFFPCQVHLFKSYHASFWTSALVKEKIDKFFFTHQQIKFAKSELVKENLPVCNRLYVRLSISVAWLSVGYVTFAVGWTWASNNACKCWHWTKWCLIHGKIKLRLLKST